jgi:hypothetical protein
MSRRAIRVQVPLSLEHFRSVLATASGAVRRQVPCQQKHRQPVQPFKKSVGLLQRLALAPFLMIADPFAVNP